MKFKKLLLAMACYLSVSAVFAADSVSITESLTDKLLTHKYKEEGETFTEYAVETTGKFSITAKISGDAFNQAGLQWTDLTVDTPVTVIVGDFNFSGDLSGADKQPALTAKKLAATWTGKEDVCDVNGEKCKSITTQKVSITAATNNNYVTIKVDGSSKRTDGDGYGQRAFADICDTNGNGVVPDAQATISINDVSLMTDLKVTCSVKIKTAGKGEESFDLKTIKVTGKKL